ncbi:MAG: M23 family metallopeptidase [Xanthobacteraceae bacterium]
MPHRRVSAHHDPGVRHGRSSDPRGHRAAALPRQADYTLVHAGRQLRLGPIAFWVVVGSLVVMGLWTITTATYFAFRDDVLTGLIARQAEMQFGYEDRIAELRAQVDRISSRQLLDQEQYEQKLDQMLRKQSVLESRAATLSGFTGIVTGTIRSPGRGEPARKGPPRPPQINDRSSIADPPTRMAMRPMRTEAAARAAGVGNTLAHLQSSLDRVEAAQTAVLVSIEQGYNSRAQRIAGVLADLGVGNRRIRTHSQEAIGGPLIAARPRVDADPFEHHVYRVGIARAQLDRLTRTVATVPVRVPLMQPLELSSGFGVRLDPFIRAPAMHTGLDLRGNTGDPIRVTADGAVTTAGWNGGYGRMVEVDHGNGYVTRYGHMSAISVSVGQSVKAGQFIGKVGSTGRSTGPHLHYETRLNGEAIDPHKFLRAGNRLTGGR